MEGPKLTLRFIAMSDVKEMFSARLMPLAKSLVKAEAEDLDCSEAQVIELWAFKYARSPKARQLLSMYSETDPLTKAVADAIREESARYRTKPSKPK